MNKNEIKKIISFTKDVYELPDMLFPDSDFSNDRAKTGPEFGPEKHVRLFNRVDDMKIRLLAYFKVVKGESSTYVDSLKAITFKPASFHYANDKLESNKAWYDDKINLLNLLKMAKIEFEEMARIADENPENSFWCYFKTKQAKGAVFATVLTIIAGIATKDIWFDRFFSTAASSTTKLSQVDSLVSADKEKVIEMTAKETFTKYYQTIKNFKGNYAPVDAERYIEEYIKEDTVNIKARIANRSYIHRFATREKLWTDSDYMEVAYLIKATTINRIKEISEDVESRAKGAFTVTEGRLQLLEEQVGAEIKN